MPKDFRVEIAEIIRDSMHNLIVTQKNVLDNEVYFDKAKCFIGALEGSKNKAYINGIEYPAKIWKIYFSRKILFS